MELNQNSKTLELEYSSWTLNPNDWNVPNLFHNRDPVPIIFLNYKSRNKGMKVTYCRFLVVILGTRLSLSGHLDPKCLLRAALITSGANLLRRCVCLSQIFVILPKGIWALHRVQFSSVL